MTACRHFVMRGFHLKQCENGARPSGYCATHEPRHVKPKPGDTITIYRVSKNPVHPEDAIPKPVIVRSISKATYVDLDGRRNNLDNDFLIHFTSEDMAVRFSVMNLRRRIGLIEHDLDRLKGALQAVSESAESEV